jgi:hypothetical protein
LVPPPPAAGLAPLRFRKEAADGKNSLSVSDILILGSKQGKVFPNSSQAKPDKPIAKDDALSRLVIANRDKVEGYFVF